MHNGVKMKSVRVSVSLPKEQHQQIQMLAENNSLSVAWLVRQAVNEFLEKNDNPQSFDPLIKEKLQGEN